MSTNWNLIRSVVNKTIDTCAEIEKLRLDRSSGEYEARSEYQSDIDVKEFLRQLEIYPEGVARDIIRLRALLHCDLKYPDELAHALVNTMRACVELIGLDDEQLGKEIDSFIPHNESAGKSVESQINAIPRIMNGWMLTGVRKALEEFRCKRTDTQG